MKPYVREAKKPRSTQLGTTSRSFQLLRRIVDEPVPRNTAVGLTQPSLRVGPKELNIRPSFTRRQEYICSPGWTTYKTRVLRRRYQTSPKTRTHLREIRNPVTSKVENRVFRPFRRHSRQVSGTGRSGLTCFLILNLERHWNIARLTYFVTLNLEGLKNCTIDTLSLPQIIGRT